MSKFLNILLFLFITCLKERGIIGSEILFFSVVVSINRLDKLEDDVVEVARAFSLRRAKIRSSAVEEGGETDLVVDVVEILVVRAGVVVVVDDVKEGFDVNVVIEDGVVVVVVEDDEVREDLVSSARKK